MATSAYVQLAPYALLEYVYSSELISKSSTKTLRLTDNYDGSYYFVNSTIAENTTGNTLNNTAARLGNSSSTRWAYMDLTIAEPILQSDPNFTLSDVSAAITANSISYDTVKLHLLSGYNFETLEGLILQINWKEWFSGAMSTTTMKAGSYTYLRSDLSKINFSTTPLFLGDRLYDRYLEFKVPSLSAANFDFWNSPGTSKNVTLAYNYSHDGVGFVNDSPISISLFEIDTIDQNGEQQFFVSGTEYTASIGSSDQYSFVSVVIQENTDNDYIEYYPSYNGGFIGDYINFLNETGDWVVINQIDVYEQIGNSIVSTANMTMLQDSNFDLPGVFRPIIRNSQIAFSYTVQYVMRLVNKRDNTEIVRRATFTSTDVKKYGAKLQKINILEGYRPIKVYNKIVNLTSGTASNVLSSSSASPQYITQTVYVNNYYDVNFISVDSTSDISNTIGETVYPQGTNTIFINKFDNVVKFKIFTKSKDKKQNVSLDLASTGMNINLAFITDDGSKFYIAPYSDISAANPGAGEVLFKINDNISTKLLGGTNREYYLINKTTEGDEVLIYSGTFADQKDRVAILEQKRSLFATSATDMIAQQTTITTPTTAGVTGATASSATTSASSDLLLGSQAVQIANTSQTQTDVIRSTSGITEALNRAATSDIPADKQINIPEVPGVTPFMGADVRLAKTPDIIKPSDPNTTLTDAETNTTN